MGLPFKEELPLTVVIKKKTTTSFSDSETSDRLQQCLSHLRRLLSMNSTWISLQNTAFCCNKTRAGIVNVANQIARLLATVSDTALHVSTSSMALKLIK